MSIPVTCEKCKGNYGKRKRGKRPFEFVFIDFVTMLNSKGKHYILTILGSFSPHFTAIPCARDRAIDAARGLYQFFLYHREIHSVLRSWLTLYWWGLLTIFQPNVHYTGTSLFLTTVELRKYSTSTSHDKGCPPHDMLCEKLWMDRRPRIRHPWMLWSALHYH